MAEHGNEDRKTTTLTFKPTHFCHGRVFEKLNPTADKKIYTENMTLLSF